MSLPARICTALNGHRPKRGMVVASGQTCECGYWTGAERSGGGNERPAGVGIDGDQLNWHRAQIIAALLEEVE